jgi:hypothetical protein
MAIDSDQGEPQVNGLVTGQWLINEWEVIPGNYSVMAKYWTEKSMSDATWNNGAPEWQLQPRAPLPTKHYNSVQRARAARRMDALCVNVDVNPEHDGERRYWHSTTFGESMVTVRNTEVHLHHDALNEFSQSLNGCVAVTFVLNSRGELVPINNTDKPDSPPACLVVKSPGDALSLRSALGPGDYTFRTVAVSQAEAKSWTSTRRFGNRDHGSIPVRLTTVDPHSYAHTAAGHTIVADVPFSV